MIFPGGAQAILGDAARTRLAAELHIEAALPAFSDPRFIALRLAMRLALRAHDGERTTASDLLYAWHSDARERGGRIHRELAAAYLLRRGIAHGRADVRLLALDVALPEAERHRGLAHLLWHQRHLPTAAIREASARLRLRA